MLRDEKLSGQSCQDKLNYLYEIMKIEGYDQETFNACKEKFDTYRFDAASNPAYASIRRKYAGAKMYPFHVRDIPEAQEETQ